MRGGGFDAKAEAQVEAQRPRAGVCRLGVAGQAPVEATTSIRARAARAAGQLHGHGLALVRSQRAGAPNNVFSTLSDSTCTTRGYVGVPPRGYVGVPTRAACMTLVPAAA